MQKSIEELKSVFAHNLSYLLESNGLSQKELSQICCVSTSTVSSWLTCTSFPRIDKLSIISSYFGVSNSDLISEEFSYNEDAFFALDLKQLRQNKGLTLEQVGAFVGVNKSTVRKWETGQIANMRRDKIEKLADILDTTPEFIIGCSEHSIQNELSLSRRQLIDLVKRLPDSEVEAFKTLAKAVLDKRGQ